MEITNEEAHIIFILLIAFTNYKSLQLADSLQRKFVAEKVCIKKLRLKIDSSVGLSHSHSFIPES